MNNVDITEVEKFSRLSEEWWKLDGNFKPLHRINPVRAQYIHSKQSVKGLKILDVGCGGGILSEALATKGAEVTGIDVTSINIKIAKDHAEKSGLNINYQSVSAEQLSETEAETFDIVACLEVLEHVPSPEKLIKDCVNLLKPNGSLFLSTINRSPRAFVTAIVGAEYLFQLLPKGTHTYEKFLKPSECVAFMRAAGVKHLESKGMFYNPLTHQVSLNEDLGVNYLLYGKKQC
ncbi:MAG: bifunctional 2-polyprenyl-6-hydroxyphenol methylase/3-demethylubiquinol 3-O-methyltransferase UbiG [Gammaproteobacteria bacterium]